jgi:hypothetical protein
MTRPFVPRGIAALVATTLWSCPAAAQSVQDFYKGKTIQLAIGFGPGDRLAGRSRGRNRP